MYEIVKNIWAFIQTEIFGMQWLKRLIGSGLELLGLDIESRLGGSIHFFIYDVIKIMILLTLLIYMIGFIQSFFPPDRTKKIISRYKGIVAKHRCGYP